MGEDQSWQVDVTSPAVRDLDRIPPRYAQAIVEFITAVLLINPHRVGKPMHNELEGLYGARRGDYRVLYRIDEADLYVHILRVDHRAGNYRTR